MQRDLVERARGGDADAFAELAGLAGDRLYGIASRILRDGDRAADATQQALIAVWEGLLGLRDPDRFDAWACRLVVNASYRVARREMAPTTGPASLAATCRLVTRAVETQSGGVTRSRGGHVVCDATSVDPRLTGTMSIFPSSDRRADGAGDTWGEASLRSADGRWSGVVSGSVDPDDTQHLTGMLFGADAYGGLRLVFTQAGTSETFVLRGAVEPADAPSGANEVVVRRLTCQSGGDPGRESMDPSGLNHVRGRNMTCAVEASDPRVAGELTLVARIDDQPDQSARIGGTESLANTGGAWIGTWDGTYDVGWTTHRWTGTVKGSGDYAGLEYRFTTIGEWPRFVQVGEIGSGN